MFREVYKHLQTPEVALTSPSSDAPYVNVLSPPKLLPVPAVERERVAVERTIAREDHRHQGAPAWAPPVVVVGPAVPAAAPAQRRSAAGSAQRAQRAQRQIYGGSSELVSSPGRSSSHGRRPQRHRDAHHTVAGW
jgi:hypothetical protein